MKSTIAIGCDPNAIELKNTLIKHLESLNFETTDYGNEDPIYANTALKVAQAVASKKHERGILLCGTGIGVALTANKVPGAYAAVASDSYSVERSIKSNNVNILTFGAQVMGAETAKSLLTTWMNSVYEIGGRSQAKVERIHEIENSFSPANSNCAILNKKKLIDLADVYTANVFPLGNKLYVVAGSENESPSYIQEFNKTETTLISSAPGGTMSLIPVPGSTNHLVSVMGLFPPFIGFDAGIFLHTLKEGKWSTRNVIHLPFAHRCEFLSVNGVNHLFVASCSKYKANPDDWKQAGEVYGVVVGDADICEWKPTLILNNLFKNHGMTKSVINGLECLCVSGTEGIFSIRPNTMGSYDVEQLFDQEVSEFYYVDFDNDGVDELVTIEVFHGNSLNVYKKTLNKWVKTYTSALSFGHGLTVGKFNGESVIIVGSRRESEALEIHKVFNVATGDIRKFTIEEGVAPTQTRLFNHEGIDYILSANQKKNEVAVYSSHSFYTNSTKA